MPGICSRPGRNVEAYSLRNRFPHAPSAGDRLARGSLPSVRLPVQTFDGKRTVELLPPAAKMMFTACASPGRRPDADRVMSFLTEKIEQRSAPWQPLK